MMLGRSRLPETGGPGLRLFGRGLAGLFIASACVSLLLAAPSGVGAQTPAGDNLPFTLPPGMSNAEIARHAANVASTSPPFHKPGERRIEKWPTGPIRVRIVDKELRDFDRNHFPAIWFVQLIDSIRSTINIDIDISEGPETDIYIFVIDERDNGFEQELFDSYVPRNVKKCVAADVCKKNTSISWISTSAEKIITKNHEIVGAKIYYNLKTFDQFDKKFGEPYAQAWKKLFVKQYLLIALSMGPGGEFSPFSPLGGGYYGVFLKLLFDDRIHAGMTEAKAAEVMKGILDRIRPGG